MEADGGHRGRFSLREKYGRWERGSRRGPGGGGRGAGITVGARGKVGTAGREQGAGVDVGAGGSRGRGSMLAVGTMLRLDIAVRCVHVGWDAEDHR